MDSYTILVIEDDFDLRELLKFLLEEANHQVIVAENGAAALQLLARWQPALILTDLMMPLVSGEQLIMALRHQLGLENVPIVVLTAFSHVFEQQVLTAGATVTDYVKA